MSNNQSGEHPHHCTARHPDGFCEECEVHAQDMAERQADPAEYPEIDPALFSGNSPLWALIYTWSDENGVTGCDIEEHIRSMMRAYVDADRAQRAAAPQAVQPAAPMFWVRLLRDGLYEGPVHNNSTECKLLRDEKPGEWHPLYLHAAPAHLGVPEGFAMVPLRMTRAMDEVLKQEDWTWQDLLAAAESITEQQYTALAATQPAAQQFQARVGEWLMECFGHDIAHDGMERNHRFLEEALELVQSLGCTQSEAHQLVDYVFGREVGEPVQELGGAMVTLAALCFAREMDMQAGAEKELARICDPAIMAKIKAKQAAKPRHSPLPQLAATQPAPLGLDAPNEWEGIHTMPTCDDLIWLYCQDTNTIDGPIAPDPSLEQYGWTHWAYANAPSTAGIDAAQAKQGGADHG